MKAKAVAYILFFWIFCFNVMAQDKDKGSIMEEVISLPFSSATISACFSLIKKKDIILSYNEGMIDIFSVYGDNYLTRICNYNSCFVIRQDISQ